MSKEDRKALLITMIPLVIVLWGLDCLCYGIKVGSIVMASALIGVIILICCLWFSCEWWNKCKRQKSNNISKENVIEGIDQQISKLDACISRLVKARLNSDELAHKKALFELESNAVSYLQNLTFLRDYIDNV